MKKRIALALTTVLIGVVAYAANEITVSAYVKAEKGTRKVDRSPTSVSINWNGSRYFGPVIYSASSNWQALAQGAITTNGIMWVRNVSTNLNVTLSFNGGTNNHILIKTNEYYFWRLDPSMNAEAIAIKNSATNTTTSDFEVTLIED